MIDLHSEVVNALSTVLPTYYEMTLNSSVKVPCISYMELGNYGSAFGDTQEYSRLQYQIKVWGHDIEELQKYAILVSQVMRSIGFNRVSSNEMYDKNSTMIQKIMTFEVLTNEVYITEV